MKQETILVVDDDKEIADLVGIHLAKEGYRVIKAYNGKEAMTLFDREGQIDLAILDIMMPQVGGIEVCKYIRGKSTIPIIMLSAKDGELDKVSGLLDGADDYVTKPFQTMELIARVKSQLRRYCNFGRPQEAQAQVVELKNLWMNREVHEAKAYGKEVHLTHIEFEILFLMASHPGKVYSTDEIFEEVWKEKSFEMSNTVMVHIRRLREKIEIEPRKAQIIKTVWGVGYKVEDN